MWALSIFVWQLQYLWAVIELPNYVKVWSLLDFLLLIGLSLCLFVAGALVLPDVELRSGDDLAKSFSRDGRWALVALSLWGIMALVTNWNLFGNSAVNPEGALMTMVTILPLLFLVFRNRKWKAGITVLNLCLTFLSAWILSPKSY